MNVKAMVSGRIWGARYEHGILHLDTQCQTIFLLSNMMDQVVT